MTFFFNSFFFSSKVSFSSSENYVKWFLALDEESKAIVSRDIKGDKITKWFEITLLEEAYHELPFEEISISYPILSDEDRIRKEAKGVSFFGCGDETELARDEWALIKKKKNNRVEVDLPGSSGFIRVLKKVKNSVLRRKHWFSKNRFVSISKEKRQKKKTFGSVVKIGGVQVRIPMSNRFSDPPEIDTSGPAFNYKIKKQKKEKKNKKNKQRRIFREKIIKPVIRNQLLLKLLRERIRLMVEQRCKSPVILPLIRRKLKQQERLRLIKIRDIVRVFNKKDGISSRKKKKERGILEDVGLGVADHQGDAPKSTAINDTISLDTTKTTEIIEQAPTDRCDQETDHAFELMKQCGEKEDFESLANKWIHFDSITWEANKQAGREIMNIDLPGGLFRKSGFSNSTLACLCRNYRYHHFDMSIKLQVNSSKMHQGSLIMFYRYLDNFEVGGLGELANYGQGVQAPHVFIRAGENNTGQLDIGYKYLFPNLVMNEQFIMDSLCRMRIRVFNRLRSDSSTSATVYGNLLVKFSNVRPSGQIFNLQGNHQMLSRVAMGALEGALDSFMPDNNRDNPTNPTPPQFMIPKSSHSWCQGNGVAEVVETLRLNPRSMVPHFNRKDEMQVSSLTSKFGFVTSFSWSNNYKAQQMIYSQRVSPIEVLGREIASGDKDQNRMAHRTSTPLSVISSLFAYWRGGIDYRFDFIAPFTTTGRIFVAFIPSYRLSRSAFTFNEAKTCYGSYFDLGQEKSFTFRVPFEFQKNWCQVGNDEDGFTGQLQIFIVNPLIYFAGTPNFCEINVFERGSRDFELSVPVIPYVFPSYYDKHIPVSFGDAHGFINPGPSSFYTKEVETENEKKQKVKVRKSLSQILGAMDLWFEPQEYFSYEEVYQFVEQDNFKRIPIYKNGKETQMKYAVPVRRTWDKNIYTEMVWFDNLEEASKFSLLQKSASQGTKWESLIDQVDALIFDSEKRFPPFEHPDVVYLKEITVKSQSDDRELDTIRTEPGCDVNRISKFFFNETFYDLKDLCRRYQLYGDASIKIKANTCFGKVICRIPVMPGGVSESDRQGVCLKQFFNQARTGVIGLLASGYRYFRGTLRFKFVFSYDPVTLAITHVPNRFDNFYIRTDLERKWTSYNPQGYSTIVQNLNVNNIVEFEVPYYGYSDYITSQIVSLTQMNFYQTMGYLDVSMMSQYRVDKEIGLQIFYSFGDDARFSSFQGFPSMITLDQIPDRTILPSLERVQEEDRSSSFEDVSSIASHQMDVIRRSVRTITRPFIGGVVDAVKEEAEEISEETLRPKIEEVTGWGKDMVSQFTSKMAEFMGTLKNMFGNAISGMTSIIYNVIVHIFSFLSGTGALIMRLVRLIVSILVTVGIITFDSIAIVTDAILKNVGIRDLNRGPPVLLHQTLRDLEILEAEHQGDVKEDAAFASTILTCMAATVGYSMTNEKRPNFFGSFLSDIRNFTMTSNSLFVFLQNNLTAFSGAYQWILMKANGFGFDMQLMNQPEDLKAFLLEAMTLTNDKSLYNRITQEPCLQRKVFSLTLNANRLMASGLPFSSSIAVRDTLQKLVSLQERLIDDCLCPNVGYEPYVLYLYGPPKVGKSSIYTSLAMDSLDAINYNTHAEKIYVRTSGNQYWNGVALQPNIVYDDFATDRESFPAQVTELFQLKSPCSFNPPTAQIEDKKRRINPIQVIICSNKDTFDDGLGFIYTPEAIARRRDALWEVNFIKTRGGKPISEKVIFEERNAYFDKHEKPTFEHLRFRKCKDPQRLNDTNREELYGNWIDYTEFRSQYLADFVNYRKTELKRYRWRFNLLTSNVCDEQTLLNEEQIAEGIEKALDNHYERLHESVPSFLSEIKKNVDPGTMQVNGLTERFVRSDPVKVLAALRSKLQPKHQADKGKGKKKKANSQPTPKVSKSERTPLISPLESRSGSSEYISEVELKSKEEKNILKTTMAKLGIEFEEASNSFNTVDNEVSEFRSELCQHWKFKDTPVSSWGGRKFVDEKYEAILRSSGQPHLVDQFYFYPMDFSDVQSSHVAEKCACNDGSNDETQKLCFFNSETGKKWLSDWLRHHRSRTVEYYVTEFPEHLLKKDWYKEFKVNFLGRENDPVYAPTTEQIKEVETFYQSFLKKIKSFYESVKGADVISWIKCLGKILAVVGVFFSGFLIYKAVKSKEESPEDEVATVDPWVGKHQNRVYESDKLGVKSRRNAKQDVKRVISLANHNSTSMASELRNIVASNMVHFRLMIKGKDEGGIKGLGLAFRTFLVGAHFFEDVNGHVNAFGERNVEIKFTKENNTILLKPSSIKVEFFEGSSLCLVQLDNRVPAVRDIRKHIASSEDTKYMPSSCSLFEMMDNYRFVLNPVHVTVRGKLQIAESGYMKKVTLPKVLMYEGHSENGLCGSVLISAVAPFKIYGLHVAGTDTGDGFSEPICYEDFVTIKHQHGLAWIDLDMNGKEDSKIPIPPNIDVMGTLPPELEPTTSIKTQKVETLMFDKIFKHETIPAPLSEFDYGLKDRGINPFNKSMEKYSNIPQYFDKDILEECRNELAENLIYTTKPCFVSRDEILTNQEMFGGIVATEGYNPLKMSTSEGFPLCLVRKLGNDKESPLFHFNKESRSGKEWLFDYEATAEGNKLKSIHPMLEKIHNDNLDLRKKGIVPESYFICTLKDACIQIEKAMEGKNRIFSNSPVELTMTTKKYFGHFQAAYQKNRISNSTAIGINANSMEWTKLANSLLSKGNNIITGDYSGFGDTLEREVMSTAFGAINDWYDYYYEGQDHEENKIVRQTIFHEICLSPQIARNLVFRRNCGIPSGFGLTVEINDLVNKLYMLYAWKVITKSSFAEFKKNVYFCCYGDDIIMSVSDQYIDQYNFETIQKFLSEKEIKFTSAEKDGTSYKSRSLFESSFLKGTFVKHPNREHVFLRKLPLASCLEMLNWQWKCNTRHNSEVCLEAARAAVLELYGQGPETHEVYRKKIYDWFVKQSGSINFPKGLIPHLMTWKEVDIKFMS